MTRPDDKPDLSGYSPEVRAEKQHRALSQPIKPLTEKERFEHDPHAEDKPPTWKQEVADLLVIVAVVAVVVLGLVKGCT